MALAGSNIASLIGILEGAFGCMESHTASTVSADNIPAASQTATQEKLPESIPTTSSGDSSLDTVDLLFPLKSPSQVVAGISGHFYPFVALRLALVTGANTHPVMRNFLKKQQPATMCAMTIYMWLWLASIAVQTIPQKCSGTVHLHGSTTPINMC